MKTTIFSYTCTIFRNAIYEALLVNGINSINTPYATTEITLKCNNRYGIDDHRSELLISTAIGTLIFTALYHHAAHRSLDLINMEDIRSGDHRSGDRWGIVGRYHLDSEDNARNALHIEEGMDNGVVEMQKEMGRGRMEKLEVQVFSSWCTCAFSFVVPLRQ